MNRWLAALLCHALFVQLAAYIIRPAAAYRALELGVDSAWLGLVAASFAVLPLLVAVFLGRAADAGREPMVLGVGTVLMLIAGAGLLLWSSSLVLLLGWNVLIGLGHLMSVVGQQSSVARVGDERLDSFFGFYTVAGSAGQAIGPAMIAVVGRGRLLPDTQALFAVYTVSCVLMAVFTVALLVVRRGRLGTARAVPPARLRTAVTGTDGHQRTQLLGAMVISMMVLAAVDLIAAYLPALGVERGISAGVIGVLLSVRAVATMASRLFLGVLVASLGRWPLIVISTAVSAVAVGALAVPMPTWGVASVLMMAGLALGIGQPLTMSVVSLAAPAGTRGTWLALRLTANRLGQSTIPAAVGIVSAATGVAGVFGATAALLAGVSGGCWVVLWRRWRGRGSPPDD